MSTLTFPEFEIMKKELLQQNGMTLKTLGHSMHPIINSGDQLQITPIPDFSQLKRFDLLVFWDHGVLMCHYLWNQNKYFGTTNGQGLIQLRPLNPIRGFDNPIPQIQVLGKLASGRLPWWLKLKIIMISVK